MSEPHRVAAELPAIPLPLPKQAIEEHLARIVQCSTFARSPQAVRFLRYVVQETLDARGGHLKAYAIGVHALAASERSDPDNLARMQAGRVRKLLASYYAGEGRHEELRIRLAPGSYEPKFVRDDSGAGSSPARSDRAVLLLQGYSARDGGEDASRVAEALDEQLVSGLVRFPQLRVWSSFAECQAARPDFVLSGTVWVVDGRLRVFSALRCAVTKERLWHQRHDSAYARPRLFEIQDEIAGAVCARLADPAVGVIGRLHRAGDACASGSREAALLAAERLALGPCPEALESAGALLDRAIEEHPADGAVRAAASLVASLTFAFDPRSGADSLGRADEHACSALRLDAPGYALHLARGLVLLHLRERESALAELDVALALNPHALAVLAWGGWAASLLGQRARGQQWLDRARGLFPEVARVYWVGECIDRLVSDDDPVRAHALARALGAPESFWDPALRALCLSAQGKRYEARRALAEARASCPEFRQAPRQCLSRQVVDARALDHLCSLIDALEGRRASEPPPSATRPRVQGDGKPTASSPRTVSVGILHSLTGTMAICERHLVDAALLAIEEINEQGGVLGCQVRPIVEDGESLPGVFASRARKLLGSARVATLFGCWTSSSRKAVRPVVEHYGSLLWYPVQYEGLERSRNIIYTGSCLNQQIEPATRWALAEGKRRFFLVGSDYVFPRTANRLIRTLVETEGAEILGEEYRQLGSGDFRSVAAEIRRLKPDLVFNTVNGADNLALFRELSREKLTAERFPVMSFSLSELELSDTEGAACGHYACWSYFQSVDGAANQELLRRFRGRYGDKEVLSDPAVTAYAQVHLWKQVAEAAGSLRTEDLLAAVVGRELLLAGDTLEVRSNHHVRRRALIGRVRPDNQFDVVWSSPGHINPRPWLGVEESNLESRALILEALGSLANVVDYNSSLELEMASRAVPARGAGPRSG